MAIETLTKLGYVRLSHVATPRVRTPIGRVSSCYTWSSTLKMKKKLTIAKQLI